MTIAFPSSSKPEISEIADWCEFRALNTGKSFKRGDLKSAIAIEDLTTPDLLEEETWNLIQTRSEMHQVHWGLKFDGTRLTPARHDDLSLIHSYLALISLGDLEQEDRHLFEEIVNDIFRWRWGRTVMRIGHPASPGMNSSFRLRVRTYARAAHISNTETPVEPFSHDKDLGLDVVMWSPTPDGRGGYPHMFVQCATGKDWNKKLKDIDMDVIRPHLNIAGGVLRAVCVPFTIHASKEKWIRYSMKAGWVLDRPRLLFLASDIELSLGRRVHLQQRVEVLTS